jgi:hypothetical protein
VLAADPRWGQAARACPRPIGRGPALGRSPRGANRRRTGRWNDRRTEHRKAGTEASQPYSPYIGTALELNEAILKRKTLAAASFPARPARRMVKRSEDFALLSFDGGVLYNNVFAKGDIQNAFQQIFLDGNQFGWEWDWPENTGPSVKTYPEVILGRSPWSKAEYGGRLPRLLKEVRYVLDFDFTSEAEGSWCDSFDFWITEKSDPEAKDITCNLCLWTRRHQIEGAYRGSQETVKIGGRTYTAIIETPAERPEKTWNTLFVMDAEPRSRGSLALQPLMEILTERGLAKPDHFLATAELGNEVAFGKGRMIVRTFRLR